MKHSKAYNEAYEQVKNVGTVSIKEALALVEKTKHVKFDETIEASD